MTNRYVKSGSTGLNDGSSWTNAYVSVSFALSGGMAATSGTTASGSATIVFASSQLLACVKAGMYLFGTGIPSGATVGSVSGATVTLASSVVTSASIQAGTNIQFSSTSTQSAAAVAAVPGDVFYLSQNHVEPGASTVSYSFGFSSSLANPITIVTCDDGNPSVPSPLGLQSTVQIGTNGNFNIYGNVVFQNVNLYSGSNYYAGLPTSGYSVRQTFSGCLIQSNNVLALFTYNNFSDAKVILNKGTQFKGVSNGCSISLQAQGMLQIDDTTIFAPGSSSISSLINCANNASGFVINCTNVDFTGISSAIVGVPSGGGTVWEVYKNCKFPTGMTPSSQSANVGTRVTTVGCGTAFDGDFQPVGSAYVESVVIRSGGGSLDGVNAQSWRVATNANCSFTAPFETEPFSIYGTKTSGTSVVSIEALVLNAGATIPTNGDYWVRVNYPTSTVGGSVSTAKLYGFQAGTALPASTATWSANPVARSTAYTVGQIVSYPSQAGMVWYCTANGTTASSDPTSGNTYSDGAVLTDGTATFQAGFRVKLTATVPSTWAGPIQTIVRAGRYVANSNLYLDPVVTVV